MKLESQKNTIIRDSTRAMNDKEASEFSKDFSISEELEEKVLFHIEAFHSFCVDNNIPMIIGADVSKITDPNNSDRIGYRTIAGAYVPGSRASPKLRNAMKILENDSPETQLPDGIVAMLKAVLDADKD